MNKNNQRIDAPENNPSVSQMDFLREGLSSRPRKSIRERASFFDEPSQKDTNKMHHIKTVTSGDNKPKKVLHEKTNTFKNEEPAFIKRNPDALKSINSAMHKERIAMLTAKMERKAPPPKPPRQLSLVDQEYKPPKSENKLESIFDAPKQPHIPHFTAFTLADLESTDSESSYSSDESDTGHEFSTKTLDNTGDVQKKKKKVSFSDKVTLIPDYIYKEEESNEKRSSVQNIMTNFNNNIKMNAKKREKHKPIKQTPQSPQRLSNKLLGFFQQKRIFTSEKPPLSNPKNHTDTTPEPLTHLTKSRPRKPSSMRKSREVKVVL